MSRLKSAIHHFAVMIILCATALLPAAKPAFSEIRTTPSLTTRGYVYRQGFVLDKAGKKSFAEYEYATGNLIGVLSQFDASDPDYLITSGREYEATQEAIENWRNSLTDEQWAQFRIVSADVYRDSGNLNGEYPEAWNDYLVEPYQSSESLVIYKPDALFGGLLLNTDDGIIVQQSKFDINQLLSDQSPSSARSLLLNGKGQVKWQSEHNIGYRVAYFDPEDNTAAEDERTDTNITQLEIEKDDVLEDDDGNGIKDALLGPIPGVIVSGFQTTYGTSLNITDEKGFFTTEANTSCLSAATTNFVRVTAEIPYRSFNPAIASSHHRQYLWYPYDYPCQVISFYDPIPTSLVAIGVEQTLIGLEAGFAYPRMPRINIPVDVSIISGTFNLYNSSKENQAAVPLESQTTKDVKPPVYEYEQLSASDNPDFNHDGETDHVSKNGSIPAPNGGPSDSAPLFGVWFSLPEGATLNDQDLPYAEDGELIAPDLVRVATYAQKANNKGAFQSMGLLKSISLEDLADTDLYVFRESTGQLVIEKKPFTKELKSPEPNLLWGNQLSGISSKDDTAFFEVRIPGQKGRSSTVVALGAGVGSDSTERYKDWQSDRARGHYITEDFRGDTDTLRKGEPLRVIAINRATGYIGTARVNAQDIEKSTNPKVPTPFLNDATIGVNVGEIKLYPPNLKINVKRHYTIGYGATQGDEKSYRIGSEGAALYSDQYIVITAQWVDEDNSPLPSDLPGYTGRLISLSSDNTLKNSNSVDHFAVKPGLHTEIINLGDAGSIPSGAQYQYLHIVGEDETEVADFGASPNTNNRPEKFVPFRVAVYDAKASTALKQAQLELAEHSISPDSSVYQWPHRPEMVYSIFDLDIAEILRTPEDENGEAAEPIDITNNETPVLTASDKELSIVQDLIASEYDPLEYFGPESHLIYSLEGYQQQVNEGEGESYSFTDFGHLGELDSDDYLTLSLLNNQDAGNVLWEFAFGYTPIAYPESGEISVDDAEQDILIVLPGFTGSQSNSGNSVTLQWSVTGEDGSVAEATTTSETGFHSNSLLTGHISENHYSITVKIQKSSHPSFMEGTEYEFGPFTTIAGEPRDISLTADATSVRADTFSKTTIQAIVRDKFGNSVEDGTAVSWFPEDYGQLVQSENETTSGFATLQLSSDDRVGELPILVVSGEAEKSITIEKTAFSLSVDAGNSSGTPLGRTISITALVPGAEDGSPINWVSTLGTVDGDSLVVGERATAVFKPGAFPGTAKVYASVGQQWNKTEIELSHPAGKPVITVTDPLLIGDRTGDGSVILDRLDGTTRTLNYKTSSAMKVSGLIPGETYQIRLGSPKNPVVEPIAWYFMDDIVNSNSAPDIYHDHPGVVTNVDVEREASYRGTGSYRFESSSSMNIAAHSALNLSDDFGVSVAIKPTAGKQTIDLLKKSNHYGIRLSKLADGYKPEFWVITEQGKQTLQSSNTIPFNAWGNIAVKVKNNTLVINVDGDEESATLNNVIAGASSDITVGDGFVGQIDDLKIFDYQNAAIASLGNNSDVIELKANANGEISTTVRSLGNLRTASPLEWIIEARVYWVRERDNVEELDTTEGFVAFMTYGIASQLANFTAQVVWDEGEGGEAIVYEFAASTFIVGDVRDIVKYGGKWYFGIADENEKLTTSLAFVGILTTLSPVADVGITALKIVIRRAADTPAANVIADLGKNIFDEAAAGSFATIKKYSDILVTLSTSSMGEALLRRGGIKNVDELTRLNTFYKAYGDNADAILNRIYTKFDGHFPSDVAQDKFNDLLKGLTDINVAIGKELTEDGIDGLAALMKVDGIDSVRLTNMAKWLRPPPDVELETVLKSIKGIDELPTKPEGYEKVFNQLTSSNKKFAEAQMRGALHVLSDVGSTAFGGISNVDKFEFSAHVDAIGGGKKLLRYPDVVSKDPAIRFEYKAWETGKVTTWGKIHGKKSGAYEFVKDILYTGKPEKFEWVVKGTDVEQVKHRMLQTLGVRPVKGRTTLHPVLEEALKLGRVSEDKLEGIIDAVVDGSLIRIVD